MNGDRCPFCYTQARSGRIGEDGSCERCGGSDPFPADPAANPTATCERCGAAFHPSVFGAVAGCPACAALAAALDSEHSESLAATYARRACRACGGSGDAASELRVGPSRAPCSRCNGSGDDASATCPRCDGNGTSTNPESGQWVTCWACHGHGRVGPLSVPVEAAREPEPPVPQEPPPGRRFDLDA